MADLLKKYTRSEIRQIKKKFKKLHPADNNKKNTEVFNKSFFGKRNLLNK